MQQKEIRRSQFFCIGGDLRFLIPLVLGILLVYSPYASPSLIDAKFKLSKRLAVSPAEGAASEVAILYRDFLSKSMYSRCRWLPSDSQYLTIMSNKCGRSKGLLLAFSRFMTENDAHLISDGIVNDDNHIRFLDLKDNCELL
jgi:putative component of membrane protein insertase Oxa1/YidC/SpoIIIJ protein YidD